MLIDFIYSTISSKETFLISFKMSSHLLNTILIFFLFFFYTTPRNISCLGITNETDRNALLSIKNLISVDHIGVLNSWNTSIPSCEWGGIICSSQNNRVISLNLSSSGLIGSLSPQIGNLTFLQKIDLRNNSFHGKIPSEIGNLLGLQILWLSKNSFHGEIPSNLSQCNNITYISLYGNNLTGTIPPQLSTLRKLKILQLNQNQLTGPIPRSFGNFSSSFTWLSATENRLSGEIPFELAKLSNLEILQFAYNNLSGEFPSFLFNISSIQVVYLTGNDLPGTLPSDLGLHCPNLVRLDVSGNKLYGTIPSAIGNLSRLQIIDLSNNSLSGSVPLNLGNLNELQALLIWGNKLGGLDKKGHKFRDFLSSLSSCSKLSLLDISENSFNGFLPNSIANLSEALTYLNIDDNFLNGNLPNFGNNRLASINFLSLQNNMFTGTIPPSIGQLVTLGRLYMRGNLFSGGIPSSIGNLTGLAILDLRNNHLEGKLPIALGNCTSLQGVDLGNNSFSGSIPKEIFSVSSLYSLTMDHNHLSGSLPEEVSKMTNLNYLFLGDNELSGEIPASISRCQSLQVLQLQGNHFQGSIPNAIRQLKGLQNLDFSRNNLSGQIPEFLGDLSELQYLSLAYNAFDGEVPSIGIFKNISAFSVSGNKLLCGGNTALNLPACQGKQSKGKKRRIDGKIIAIVTVASVFSVLILLLLSIFYMTKRHRKRAPTADKSSAENQLLQLSYQELLQATDGFSPNNLIGEGRFSAVYKGFLHSSEQVVAVKVLKLEVRGASKSFFAECEALKNIRHRNLVKIITSCSSVDFRGNQFKALVFEYMGNNSLDSWLHQDISKTLNLDQRLNIAIDVASALDYLHNQCKMGIVHCDLKPGNILLDKDFCAHVADFGLTKILTESIDMPNHQDSSTIAIRGTIGYVAPEYGMGEEATILGDMYSYGILLLELLTGKRPTDSTFIDNNSLRSYVNMYLSDQVLKVIDPKILSVEEDRSSISRIHGIEQCLGSILRIGLICSADSPSERMDASDVVDELHKIRISLSTVMAKEHNIG